MTSETPFIIIGGGPAGLMAAETLLQAGHPVRLFERMPSLGRKFLMAGRGGLNLTHAEDLARFLPRYGEAAPLLLDAIKAFPPEQVRQWVEDLGQPTFVGSSGRIFPEAMKASPLLRAWLGRLEGLGLVVHLRHRWLGWTEAGDLRFETPEGESIVAAAPTLLALGGASWPRLGADGGWTGLLAGQGMSVSPLEPSNVGVRVAWSPFMARAAGQPLKRIRVRIDGVEASGEAVITRQGLEGGVIYALSRPLRHALEKGRPARLEIDLRPDFRPEWIAHRLREGRSKDSWTSRLRKAAGLQPAAMALVNECGRRLGLAPGDHEGWAALVRAAPVPVEGLCGLDRAISSAGGAAFDGLDDHWMARARPGLFLAGEMLDWDAPTGGYLLQACFASGRAAALGMIRHAQGT
ncbi:MAG: TIGR03862 family flavoprotein [Beijerinckiaceae bacterium]|jgi:uncharacterized flavoprotein (TIGR03862 family)|nr:TIGR03862 family flavoprotein [Beijerinckiaceae bacterium]